MHCNDNTNTNMKKKAKPKAVVAHDMRKTVLDFHREDDCRTREGCKVNSLLAEAVKLHEAGKLADAETIYSKFLQFDLIDLIYVICSVSCAISKASILGRFVK